MPAIMQTRAHFAAKEPIIMSTINHSSDAIGWVASFNISQFNRMLETGVLTDRGPSKPQLFRGKIVYMNPPNPPHDDVISLLTEWAFESRARFSESLEIRVQLSMDLHDQDSVVSPDLMIVTSQSYSSRRPTASDTRLLIEVSDTSLASDTNAKRDLYAEAGVPEYWVIDIPHRSLIVHRQPADGRYRTVQTYDENEAVEPEQLGGISLTAGRLFR